MSMSQRVGRPDRLGEQEQLFGLLARALDVVGQEGRHRRLEDLAEEDPLPVPESGEQLEGLLLVRKQLVRGVLPPGDPTEIVERPSQTTRIVEIPEQGD